MHAVGLNGVRAKAASCHRRAFASMVSAKAPLGSHAARQIRDASAASCGSRSRLSRASSGSSRLAAGAAVPTPL